MQWTKDQFDGLVDAEVQTNEDMGRSEALQPASQWWKEKFGRVARGGKPAHVDNTEELARWGRYAGDEQSEQDMV